MGALTPLELGSTDSATKTHEEVPVDILLSNGALHEKNTPGQLGNDAEAVNCMDGERFTEEDAFPASDGLIECQKTEEHIVDKGTDAEASTPQPVDSSVNNEMEETTFDSINCNDDGPPSLAGEESHGLVLDQIGAEGDGSGWTNDFPLGGVGAGSGWISVEGSIPDSAAGSLPDQAPPLSGRRTHYLARIPRFVDAKLRNEIRSAELQLEDANRKRDFLRAALQLKRASKTELLEKLRSARDHERASREVMHSKRNEMEPFQQTLKKFRAAHSMAKEKGQELCSSEEELNERLAYIQHRIQHESISLKEEKQLVREIKQLEASRSQVCANMASQAEMLENLGPREDSQEQCRLLGLELDALKKEHQQARAELEGFEKEMDALTGEIDDLWQQSNKANDAQQEAYAAFKTLRKQESVQNDEFYQNKRDIQAAKQFAFQKNYEALEELCKVQVERILGLWNNVTEFRASYVKNNERSTLKRLETLDGRSLGPDEEPPLVLSNVDALTDLLHKPDEIGASSGRHAFALGVGRTKNSKMLGEEAKVPIKVSKATSQGSLPETNLVLDSKKSEERNAEVASSRKPAVPSTIVGKSSLPPQTDSVEDIAMQESEAAELKEKRRQEEMAKAREAADRKKRQTERALAKAQIRAQKEAERRQKEREKKAQKKAVAAANAADRNEANPADIASKIGTRETMPTTDEHSMYDPLKETAEVSRVSTLHRKKHVEKKLKASKPAARNPFIKKGTMYFPIWLWVVLAMVVLIVIFGFMLMF